MQGLDGRRYELVKGSSSDACPLISSLGIPKFPHFPINNRRRSSPNFLGLLQLGPQSSNVNNGREPPRPNGELCLEHWRPRGHLITFPLRAPDLGHSASVDAELKWRTWPAVGITQTQTLSCLSPTSEPSTDYSLPQQSHPLSYHGNSKRKISR